MFMGVNFLNKLFSYFFFFVGFLYFKFMFSFGMMEIYGSRLEFFDIEKEIFVVFREYIYIGNENII